MSRFTDLPPELVAEVWKYVMAPEDVMNFAVVSKTVHHQALPSLYQHRQLLKDYTIFSTDQRSAHAQLVDQLKDILAKPHAGLYVRRLHLVEWFIGRDAGDLDSPPHPPYSNEDRHIFRNALAKIILPEKLQYWISEFENGNEDVLIAILLLWTPNVEELTYKYSHVTERLLDAMKKLALKTVCPNIFSNLKTLSLDPSGMSQYVALTFWTFAASIASLKAINVRHKMIHSNQCWRRSLPPGISNVERLTFTKCYLPHPTYLNVILSSIKSLELFAFSSPYEEQSNFVTKCRTPDFNSICDVLSVHAKASLTSLCLTAALAYHHHPRASPPIINLQEFEKLENLEVSLDLIVISASPLLVTHLPSSIQTINVRNCESHNSWMLKGLAKEMVDRKAESLCELRVLTYHVEESGTSMYPGKFDTTKDLCKSAGLALTIEHEARQVAAGP